METYEATAMLEDGRTLTASGSIAACAEWCETVVRCNRGEAEIRIRRTEGGRKA